MNSQEKFDKKRLAAWNYRIIRDFRSKTQDDVVKETGILKQNVSIWENLKGNPGQEFIDQLSEYFKVSKETFYRENLTKEYLETHFSGEKPTSVEKTSDNSEKEAALRAAYKTVKEGNTEYVLIPMKVLDKTQLVSIEELAEKNRELERKNGQIDFYQNQIGRLLENLELTPKPANTKKSKE